jgi:DNA-directed RNA polymerase specialized sigma24 family protein
MVLSSVMVDDDDAALAAAIKEGNQQSFGELYDKYAPALMGIISRIVKDTEQAEEILNNTFVNVWNQIAQYNGSQGTLLIWLINMARKTAFAEIKNAPLTTPKPKTPVYEGNINGVYGKSTATVSKTAFDMVYYGGLSFIEAAETLNISVAELRNNIRQAVKSMKDK